MKNILCFFYLTKVFGLAPYKLQVDVKHSRVASVFCRLPTFLMIILYSVLVCSIFWKNKAVSDISNTVNWIQVNFSWQQGRMKFVIRIPNILLLLTTVYSKRHDFLHHSSQCREFSLDNSSHRNFDSCHGSKAETFSGIIWQFTQTYQTTFDSCFVS